ncbi:MAG TPA: hypothetical protein VEG44_04245 [Candidatus Acidoferrales bacterium]|nr:hypothetical protein [Candidatus Acidoferrales bacterium]
MKLLSEDMELSALVDRLFQREAGDGTDDDRRHPIYNNITVCLTDIYKTEKIMWSKNLLIRDLCIPITVTTVRRAPVIARKRKGLIGLVFVCDAWWDEFVDRKVASMRVLSHEIAMLVTVSVTTLLTAGAY